MSHPCYFYYSTLCDLPVDVEARSALEEGDGFPQISFRHLHQRCYTLEEQTQSSHLDYYCLCKESIWSFLSDLKPKKIRMKVYACSWCRHQHWLNWKCIFSMWFPKEALKPSGRTTNCMFQFVWGFFCFFFHFQVNCLFSVLWKITSGYQLL